LNSNSVRISRLELELLMDRYNRNRDGKVSYKEVSFLYYS